MFKMDNVVENKPAIFCKTCVIFTVFFILLFAIIYGFVQLSMCCDVPTIIFVVLGLILCVFIVLIVTIIFRKIAGPLPNNQHSGSNPNLEPYFGSNTTTLGPTSGPYNQFSSSDTNLDRGPQFGPYVTQFSGPASGPYNNQLSGPMGPSPELYNPNMGSTNDNASSPSAPPPPPCDFDVNPPSYDDAIKKI